MHFFKCAAGAQRLVCWSDIDIYSGVACMYACMLEHPHHFAKKKETKKKMKKRKKEREREREKSENYGKVIR